MTLSSCLADADQDTYVAYGSGTPKWLAVPIFAAFIAAALTLILSQVIFTAPIPSNSVNGFMTVLMYALAIPLACVAAHGVWTWMTWRLRAHYPDKVLVYANEEGIGTANNGVIPYAEIRRIDPCSFRSKYGADNWIEIQRQGWSVPTKIHVNMALDRPEQILKELRRRARAAGADLEPALPNGRPPSTGTQLGYRMGYLPGE